MAESIEDGVALKADEMGARRLDAAAGCEFLDDRIRFEDGDAEAAYFTEVIVAS